jgi:hypothetical protein
MENFNDLMFEALGDTLKLVLGETISQLVHSLTEKQSSFQLQGIGSKSEITLSYLEKLVGAEGTQIIQNISIKRLCLKLKQEYEEVEAHFSFLDELYELKFKLLTPLLNGKHSTHN